MFQRIDYLLAQFGNSNLFQSLICSSGHGIRRRAGRFQRAWEPHLQHSKLAQQKLAECAVDCDSLLVLGAGELFDFQPSLAEKFSSITFLDANPVCKKLWLSFADQHRVACETIIRDASGVLEPRIQNLKSALTSKIPWDNALEQIRQIGTNDLPSPEFAGYSAIISLNLLSQIPIVWQDAVEILLRRRFGRSFVSAREAEWLQAYLSGAQDLIRRHQTQLAASNAPVVLLISDLEYRTTSAGTVEIVPALFDCEPAKLKNYNLVWQDSWAWEILPQASKRPDATKLTHKVGAFLFLKD